jgi:hypothetical protein
VHVVQANLKLWIGICHLRCVIAAAELGSFRRRRVGAIGTCARSGSLSSE